MNPIDNLTNQLSRLPGIGQRTAERLVYYLIDLEDERVDKLIGALNDLKTKVTHCSVCNNFTSEDPCAICSDVNRDKSTIAVVEYPKDVQTIEKANMYKGGFHVLHGDIISSQDGNLKVSKLLERIKNEDIKEIILALSSDSKGEASIIYMAQILEPLGIKVSRIGYGLPYGSNMDFFDSETINIAIDNRTEVK